LEEAKSLYTLVEHRQVLRSFYVCCGAFQPSGLHCVSSLMMQMYENSIKQAIISA